MLEVIDIEGQKMEKVKNIIIRVTDKLEESCVLGAIRQAMIMMIPLLVVGYMSAMFLNLPIPAYQTFITTLFGGRVTEVLQCVYSTVNDFFLCIFGCSNKRELFDHKTEKAGNI